jgi:A/G-specific adenine glycosylase
MTKLNEVKKSIFRSHLLAWGDKNIQYYPWRFINDPYKILISEFMLHRTQVNQVIPVFNKFIDKYPNIQSCATLEYDDAREILSPLGLFWRSDSMVSALIKLNKSIGKIPFIYEDLISIPGIGPYIAGAVICFSQNIHMTLIDTNIVRTVGRLFGLDLHGEARRRKTVFESISIFVDPINPRMFYYSIIDFAHQICLSRKPKCAICPLIIECEYWKGLMQP